MLKATLIFFIPALLIAAPVKAQYITLDADNVEVSTLFDSIHKQSKLGVVLSGDNPLKGAKKISCHVKNKPVIDFLIENLCFAQPFTYEIREKTIYLFKRTSAPALSGDKMAFYWGRFKDSLGDGVSNVTVYNLQKQLVATSNSHGKFYLRKGQPGYAFTFSSPAIEPGSFILDGDTDFTIEIKYRTKVDSLAPVDVIHIGITQVSQKRNVGASTVVTANTLQKRTTPSVYNRMEGFIPGLLLTTNRYPNIYQSKHVSIGGRSTIFSGSDPLLIVNGFPFIGRLEDINADDIESITILRDASATAMWGSLSGNCVMVITTKTGKFNQPTRVSFNASMSLGTPYNAFDREMLPPSDRFFLDSFLARKGYYNFLLGNPSHPYVPELALRILKNSISEDELAFLKQLDIRNDQNKYFYRHRLDKHFTLQMTGGKKEYSYLFSLGLDHSLPELQLSKTQRLNLHFNYNRRPIEGLEISTNLATTWYKEHNLDGEPATPVTYASLTDSLGNPARMSYGRNKFFIDTAGVDGNNQRKLRDWEYRPLKEFRLRNNDGTYIDHRVQVGVKYNNFNFLKGLEAKVYAQYEWTSSDQQVLNDKDGFYANNLVNSYSYLEGNDVKRPIPVGNILDLTRSTLKTFNLRAQLAYAHRLGKRNSITVLIGSDRTFTKGSYLKKRVYDYTSERPEGQSDLNYQIPYAQYYFPASTLYIPHMNDGKRTGRNYISYYANTNLQFKGKYHLSIVARTDRSNIYGTETNTGFKPLGSIGAAWDISDEKFFHQRIFETVKLRSSIGISGNPPLGVSAVETIKISGKNEYGDSYADIINPPLSRLKWETVMTYNLGVNFSMIKHILEGTLDYYYKKTTDLVSTKRVDPSVGTASMMANVGSMASHNVDLMISTRNLNRMLRWRSTFIFTYLKEFVIKADTALQPAWMYCDPSRMSVVRNRPLYGIYAFPSLGLDAEGDPIGPNKSKNYQSTTLSQGLDALNYHGRSTPPIFGSITNEFNYKQFGLSITLEYKLNFYYRQPSVNYTGLFNGTDAGSKDFTNRWQKAGDEQHTNVPRMSYPADNNRDFFYIYSDKLVKRADFIRLHNIHLSYDLEGALLRKLHMRVANFYFNCDNAGIIWRATPSKRDLDRLQGFRTPTVLTIGFMGQFK